MEGNNNGVRRRWGRRGGAGQPAERGAAAVEFALVLIPLSMMLFGIISYGYMLSFRQAVSQAAAEGARAAAVTPAGMDDGARADRAIEAVNLALASYGMSCDEGALDCVAVRPAAAVCTDCFSVTVDYDYETDPLTPVFPGLGIVMPDHLVYTASAEVS